MRRWWCCAFAVAAVCLGAFAPAAVAADPGTGTHSQSNPDGHVVSVDPWTVVPGQTLLIGGSHFPAGIDVYGEICGDDDLAGSQDCVLDDIGFGGTNSLGRFAMSVKAAIPPAPCPCVALVFSPQLTTTPSSPVNIVGAPDRAAHAARVCGHGAPAAKGRERADHRERSLVLLVRRYGAPHPRAYAA